MKLYDAVHAIDTADGNLALSREGRLEKED